MTIREATNKVEAQHWNRLWAIPTLFGIFVGSWWLNQHFTDIASFWTGIPQNEIGFKGVEFSQALTLALYKLSFGIVVAAILAWLTGSMVAKERTNGWSRWLILFALYLWCFCTLATR